VAKVRVALTLVMVDEAPEPRVILTDAVARLDRRAN
jgi:hypothetical protein